MKALNVLMNFFRTKDPKIVTYLGVLLTVGVLLLLLSGPLFRRQPPYQEEFYVDLPITTAIVEESSAPPYERDLERRLQEALSLVEGAGRVKVMLSITQGRETVFAVDSNTNTSVTQEQDAQGGSRYQSSQQSQDKTLILSDRAGVSQPLIVKEIEPVIGGVIIIAEGGDDVLVKDALTRGASTLLGIEINKVHVMRMRGE